MNKEQFLRGAISNLENKLFATMAELEALKASIPQVKHDAIMTMQSELVKQVSSECRCGALDDVDNFIYEYSQEFITQDKDVCLK